MEYRIVTNGEEWMVQRRRARWLPWFSKKRMTWGGDTEAMVYANKAEACAAMGNWRIADQAAARRRRHGWQPRECK